MNLKNKTDKELRDMLDEYKERVRNFTEKIMNIDYIKYKVYQEIIRREEDNEGTK